MATASVVFVILSRLNVEVELFAGDLLVDGKYVSRRRLEMARRIVALGDVEGFCGSVVYRLMNLAHRYKHLKHRAKKLHSRLDLCFWVVGFHCG